MALLLQLNGDLPERFPGHQRRLYIFSCKKKACRRKKGSIKALRGTRVEPKSLERSSHEPSNQKPQDLPLSLSAQAPDLGSSIFKSNFQSVPSPGLNPFSKRPEAGMQPIAINPFSSTSKPMTKTARPAPESSGHGLESLADTFADKAKISKTPEASQLISSPAASWPPQSELPKSYPSYFLDSDTEYLDPVTPPLMDNQTAKMDVDSKIDASDAKGDKEVFESAIDKTFQRFAERVAQNADQVLRYEFGGTPLLYSSTDAVGQLFRHVHSATSLNAKVSTTPSSQQGAIPSCPSCSSPRVFELQLVPHAIDELEADEEGFEGMDWGTVMLGVCARDCSQVESADTWEWKEEWVGVQWEELQDHKTGKSKGKG